MGRRHSKRPYQQAHTPLNMGRLLSMPRSVHLQGGDTYSMHYVQGNTKSYTCPGCYNTIAPHTRHVVAWAVETDFWNDSGVESRRHWHTHCWQQYQAR